MSGTGPPIARLVRSADFERVLRTRSRASTAHFAVHHLASAPSARSGAASRPVPRDLSTGDAKAVDKPVDDFPDPGLWLGAIVPKRHARRAVTRSLLKRQMRVLAERHRAALQPGLWIVRLRAPFDRAVYVSAASEALRLAAGAELDLAFAAATRGAGRAFPTSAVASASPA